MLEQINNAVTFYAWFVSSKQGKTGLTVTTDVYNPAGTLVVTAGSATAVGQGLYKYTLASVSVTTEGEYLAIFKTSDTTVDMQQVPAMWVVGRAGIEDLDATVSSRASATDYTTARAAKLDNLDATVSSRSTLTAAQVNTEADTALSDVGYTAARSLKLDNLDATVSSRSTLTAAQVNTEADTALSDVGYTALRSAKLDNLDALISSRLAATSYSAPDLSNLDVAVSTRLASANYTAPPSAASVASAVWGAVTRTLTASGDPNAAAIADAVLDELLAGHTDSGSVGSALAQVGALGSAAVTVVAPVTSSGDITVVRGDDYAAADGRALSWTDTGGAWPDLTGATIVLTAQRAGQPHVWDVTCLNPGDDEQTLQAEPTSAQTALLHPGQRGYKFDIQATLANTRVVTLVLGVVSVTEDQTRTA